MANFADEDHDVVNWNANESAVMKITALANGQHTHYSAGTSSGLNGTMIDVGGHGYETSLDHTHSSSTAISFKKNPTDITAVTNFKDLFEFEYTPPTVRMAFIMYNATIP